MGRSIFKCFGDKIKTFLDYTDNGSEFAYGNLIINVESVFAFRVIFFHINYLMPGSFMLFLGTINNLFFWFFYFNFILLGYHSMDFTKVWKSLTNFTGHNCM